MSQTALSHDPRCASAEAAAQNGEAAVPPQQALKRVEQALLRVRERVPDLPVLAIRWMFIKHPLHPAQKELMRLAGWSGENGEAAAAYRSLAWRAARCLLYGIQLTGRLSWLRLRLRAGLSALRRKKFPLIAKTCSFEPAPPSDGSDFYYGDLSQRLEQRGIASLLLCSDVRGLDWKKFSLGQVSLKPPYRLPEWALAAPLDPLRVAAAQLLAAWRLYRLKSRLKDTLECRAARLATHECLTPHTAAAALNFWIAKRAVKAWRPRAFLTFYEGHAWERCAWWGARTADPACKIVGYQHTAVFEASRSVTAPSVDLKTRSVPDLVLCLGRGPLELMRPGLEPLGTKLLPVGSFRHRGQPAAGPADPSRRTVLVAPEGIRSEVKALFSFALACAREIPSYTFILRCHPEIPMPQALQLADGDLAGQPNILLSEDCSLGQDCDRSSILLSRGSSTVMYGILRGLRPVYGPVDDTMPDWDPVYALRTWRDECSTPGQLAECLAAYERSPQQQRESEWAEAVRYVQAYTGPVPDERIDALAKEAGLR